MTIMTRQKWIALTVTALILLGAIAAVFFLLSLTPKKVTLTYNSVPGANVALYKVDEDVDLHDLTDEKTIGKEANGNVKSGEELSLQRGTYVISVSGTSVEKKQYPLIVTDDTQKTISITYSRAYLDTLLKTVEPSVLAALKRALPTLDSIYSVRSGKLYQNGDWYAARLRYIGPDKVNRDALKVILKKAGNEWELVTRIPEIIVTYPKYPNVPRDVIADINSDEPVKIVPVGR